MPFHNVGDLTLYYEKAGTGPTVLLLHGLGSSTVDWRAQVAYFSNAYQVVTFDLRGHGRSDKPPGPYSIPLYTADTISLITSLDIAPVHVVGLSMGGMVAFQLAVTAPTLLKSLTIVNSMPEVYLRSAYDRFMFIQRMILVRLLGMRKTGEFLSKRLLPGAEQEDVRKAFVDRFAQNDKRAYLDAVRSFIGWGVTEHLPALTTPTLVIASDQDYTSVAYKQAYTAQLPNAKLAVIDDARHAVPVERPQAFNEVLARFLARVET